MPLFHCPKAVLCHCSTVPRQCYATVPLSQGNDHEAAPLGRQRLINQKQNIVAYTAQVELSAWPHRLAELAHIIRNSDCVQTAFAFFLAFCLLLFLLQTGLGLHFQLDAVLCVCVPVAAQLLLQCRIVTHFDLFY